MVTWAPSMAYFGNPYTRPDFEIHLARFRRVLDGTTEALPKLITHPTVADVERLRQEPFIAVDIETAPENSAEPWSGKDPTRCRLKTIGLGCPTWGLSFVWLPEHADLSRAVADILADVSLTKVFTNGTFFDLPVLERHGFTVR